MIPNDKYAILNATRKVLEAHYSTLPTGRNDLTGMCAIAAKLLERFGVGRFVYGQAWADKKHYTEHCWNVTGDYIVDITASQFKGPAIVIHHLDLPLPYPVRYIEIGQPQFEEWPEWQQPKNDLLKKFEQEISLLIRS